MTTWAQIADILAAFPRDVLERSEVKLVEIVGPPHNRTSQMIEIERAVVDSRFGEPFLALVKRYPL